MEHQAGSQLARRVLFMAANGRKGAIQDRKLCACGAVVTKRQQGNQGPIGQAHLVESAFPLEHGAAYKCPTDAPYLNDWCCIGGGAFVDLVIDSIFGADLTLSDVIKVRSCVGDFAPNGRLDNLRYQGKQFVITAARAAVQ